MIYPREFAGLVVITLPPHINSTFQGTFCTRTLKLPLVNVR